MKIKLKSNKTLEGIVTLPPKPEEVAEKIEAQTAKVIALADGPMEVPTFDGQGEQVESDPNNPVTYPDIIIHQDVASFDEYIETSELFKNPEDFSTIETEDEETQETRTFNHVYLAQIALTPQHFDFNNDPEWGDLKPRESKLNVDVYLRGIEEETSEEV